MLNITENETSNGYKTLIPTLNPQCVCANDNCECNNDETFKETTYVNDKGNIVFRRKCQVCGNVFETLKSDEFGCSEECLHEIKLRKKRESYKKKHENDVKEPRVCKNPNCGKTFIPFRNNAEYCSPECRVQDYLRKRKNSPDPKGIITVNCVICGKPFETPDRGKMTKKCCCEEHTEEYRRQYHYRMRAEKHNKEFENGIEGYDYVVCPICGEKHTQINMFHFRTRHGIQTKEELDKLYPNFQMTCRKMVEDNLIGENNPCHSSKTTSKQRNERSHYSLEYYKTKYNCSDEEAHQLREEWLDEVIRPFNKDWVQATSLEWYTRQGYTIEEAIQMRHDKYVANGREWYIKKFGEEEGNRRYRERMNQWNENFKNTQHSYVADECVAYIIEGYENIYDFKYGENEAIIEVSDGKMFKPDLLYGNKIIEFFGDFWHANPTKYPASYFHRHKEMTAQDIWDYDRKRTDDLESQGYHVFIIWEWDYTHDTERVINEARKFLFGDDYVPLNISDNRVRSHYKSYNKSYSSTSSTDDSKVESSPLFTDTTLTNEYPSDDEQENDIVNSFVNNSVISEPTTQMHQTEDGNIVEVVDFFEENARRRTAPKECFEDLTENDCNDIVSDLMTKKDNKIPKSEKVSSKKINKEKKTAQKREDSPLMKAFKSAVIEQYELF